MQKEIQKKLEQMKKVDFLVVVDFAGTLFALGPDKDHIKDDFLPDDAEYLSGKRAIKGATELDPRGYKYKKPEPFQKGVRYGWTVIPSVAKLLHDIKGINIIASSVANQAEQVSLQKMAFKDNHIRINHIMTKDEKGIVAKGYRPSTIVVLGDTSSDVELAENIAKESPNAKVICGFTPSGMQQHKTVQEVLSKQHPNIEFISGETWSIVIKKLRKRLPLRSHHLHQFKKFRKQKGHLKNKSNFPSVRHGR
jgi:hypothetical protein